MPTADTTPPAQTSILLDMVVSFLAPLFYAVTGQDHVRAREAARAAVAGCESLPPADLLFHAQSIALSITAMMSLAESMAPGLSVEHVIKLRTTASALSRTAERNLRVLAPKGQKSWVAGTVTTPAAAVPPHAANHVDWESYPRYAKAARGLGPSTAVH